MTEDAREISTAYRSSRRNTTILCGIGIAWTAAQFEIESVALGSFGNVSINTASIPILVAIMCIYTMARCTLDYMMQPKSVRQWSLAQIDYRITIYLVRFTLVALTGSAIARTWEMVLYIAVAFLIGVIGFLILAFAFMLVMMPLRLWIRNLSGRKSVASAAIEATYYSFALSGLTYVLLIILFGFNVINPWDYLGGSYSPIPAGRLLIFSGVILLILVSFFLDNKYLGFVFAYEPALIKRKYFENGREIYLVEPNPNHPDYEQNKTKSPLAYTKIKRGEEELADTENSREKDVKKSK